jgi:protein gp37
VSQIEWTGITWNPVTGCDRISPGCDHCYALALARRLKAMGQARYQADGSPVTSGPGFAVTCHLATLTAPYRWRTPRLVFVNSMSDLFHARVPAPFIADVFAVMAATPAHTYQILTKRPRRALHLAASMPWPGNIWLGVSIENARYLHRADTLRAIPAAVRFISAEPLLGPLDDLDLTGLGWVIAGGESGPGYRPPDPAWFRSLRDQAAAAGVPFFFKQWGGPTPKAGGRTLDGRTWDQMPPTNLTAYSPQLAASGRIRPRTTA